MSGFLKTAGALIAFFIVALVFAWFEPTQSSQIGFNGVAMQVTDSEERMADRLAVNEVPLAPPRVPSGPLAVDSYKNVQVLGHLTTGEFVRVMNSITAWVSPAQGCGYCHNNNDLAADDKYTKVVSRRMLQMTMHINENWQRHVQNTGVTCYTCHRGQPVPRYIWFQQPQNKLLDRMLGYAAQQNNPLGARSRASLPTTSFQTFLLDDQNIRIQSGHPLPGDNRSSIKQAEWTYALMMHFSRALGVNCTYCHNSRSWADWSQSPAPRATAWHGIRMVRHLNNDWLVPLTETFPPNRLGPLGDGPKLNCSTCHQGSYKPLLGKSMLPDYPSLAKAMPQPQKGSAPTEPAADGVAGAAP
ncbi:MAG: photosynthetic reaction center cytochrome PufC [Myxococcota bacterium]